LGHAIADERKTSGRFDLLLFLSIVAIAASYVASAKVGFSLAFETQQVSAVWPPTGIAIAALVLLGYRVWPGVWLGAFVSNAITNEPLWTAALIATSNTLGPLLGALLLRRVANFDVSLERVRDIAALVLFGSIIAMTVTATNGVFSLALAHVVPWSSYLSVWLLWWSGDAMGVLLVAPLIFTWSTLKRPFTMSLASALEHAAFAIALVAATWFLFLTNFQWSLSLYPLIIWCGLRFHQRAVALTIVTVSAIAIVGTLRGLGPFTSGSLDHRLVLLVTFMAVLGVTGLVLGALTAERRSANARLKEAEQRLTKVAQIVPQMLFTADKSGRVDWHNSRWHEYTGQSEEEAMGLGWQDAYHPEDVRHVVHDWPRSIGAGEPFDYEARIRRGDGTSRWFLIRAEPLRDPSGSVIRWYGTKTDIDHQKLALQQSKRVAESLQAAFLPAKLPVRPDLRFDALYLPAGPELLVGGDWYDVFERSDGHLVVSVGDVVGHGLRAAVTAGRIKHHIFALAADELDPGEILARANRILQSRDATLATALVAVIDPDLQFMHYASAGHPPPIFAAAGVPAFLLPTGGTPLGLGDLDVETHSIPLERDAVVVFYTDGITEFARDIEQAESELRSAATRLIGDADVVSPALAVQRAVMGSKPASDDTVVIVLQLTAPRASKAPLGGKALSKRWLFESSDPSIAREARHELMRFIREHASSSQDVFRTELIIGELLANAVGHAPGLVMIEIDWVGSEPLLTISDTGPGLTGFTPGLPGDQFTESGRGLFLVGNLANDVKIEPLTDRGTTIRVVLPVTRSEPST